MWLRYSGIEYSTDRIIFIANNGEPLLFEDIAQHLELSTGNVPYSGYIIEEKIEQHDMVKSISDFTLITILLIVIDFVQFRNE